MHYSPLMEHISLVAELRTLQQSLEVWTVHTSVHYLWTTAIPYLNINMRNIWQCTTSKPQVSCECTKNKDHDLASLRKNSTNTCTVAFGSRFATSSIQATKSVLLVFPTVPQPIACDDLQRISQLCLNVVLNMGSYECGNTHMSTSLICDA